MYPVITHIDALGFAVLTYSVLILVAALVGIAVALPRLGRVPGLDRRTALLFLFWCCVGGWVGGRAHHLLNVGQFAFDQIVTHGRTSELFAAAFHAGGAVLGVVIAGLLVARRRRVDIGVLGDAVVPGFGLGLAIGRFACFLHGCCTGERCDYLWCVAFPKPTHAWNYHVYLGIIPDDATWSAPVHPLQLYFTAVGLVIFAVGLWLDRRKRYEGQSALVALAIFAASNAYLEQFRGFAPLRRYWYGVPQLTWVALATLAATLIVMAWIEARRWQARDDSLREVAT